MNKCVIISNLNVNYDIGVVNVNGEMRKCVKNFFANRHTYSRGVERKFFIGTFCVDFEGLCKNQVVFKVFAGGGNYNVHILFDCGTSGNSRNSEYHPDPSECLVQIDILVDRLNGYR